MARKKQNTNDKWSDMTSGRPLPLILEFMIPLLMSQLFYQLYGMVDTMIVGRGVGVDALAAVGSTASLNYLVCGFCLGVCNGLVIPVAQKFGARDYETLRKFVAGSVWIAGVMARRVTMRKLNAKKSLRLTCYSLTREVQ